MISPAAPVKGTSGSIYLSSIFMVASTLGYFVPTLIGWKRQVDRLAWIFTLNFLAGWTAVGWMIALIWAMEAASDSCDY
jgi:hypothetical protein